MNYKSLTDVIGQISGHSLSRDQLDKISKVLRQFENGIKNEANLALQEYLLNKLSSNEIALKELGKKHGYIKGRSRHYMLLALKKPCRQNRDSALHYIAQEEILKEILTKMFKQ